MKCQVLECSKCLPTNVPDNWTVEKKAEIDSLIRTKGLLFASNYFKPVEMGLKDAKSVYVHVTKVKGVCHRCKTELTEYEGQRRSVKV